MKEHLRRWMPSREALLGHRWLRWLGPGLHHPRLWRMSRRGMALGIAIGLFFGLLLPVAQMPCSAVLAVVLRANLPAAVASTLVTNPVTSVPLYYAAWRVGSAMLGQPVGQGLPPKPAPPAAAGGQGSAHGEGWLAQAWRRVAGIGKPLMLGLGVLACSAGAVAYFAVSWIWRAKVVWVRRGRLRRREAAAG
jgi:uncharacterized protein (DUF2062 family)